MLSALGTFTNNVGDIMLGTQSGSKASYFLMKAVVPVGSLLAGAAYSGAQVEYNFIVLTF
jgi:hypothetical protein